MFTIEFSPCPNKYSRSAPPESSCRASSEPIEPPAPVIITRFPRRYFKLSPSGRIIGVRPKISSIFTSRICTKCAVPLTTWLIDGRMRICKIPARFKSSYTSRIRSPDALGIAIIASDIAFCAAIGAISSIGPNTGIPSIFFPIKSLSSSKNALTLPKIFFLAMS